MGALVRAHDWGATSLGDPAQWSAALRAVVSTCLASPVRGCVMGGDDLLLIYNDAYRGSLGNRHPGALGRPAAEVWAPGWARIAPSYHDAMRTGLGFLYHNVVLPAGDREDLERWWNLSAAPIRDDDGRIIGLFNQAADVTEQIVAERTRDAADRELRTATRAQERDRLWRNTQDIQLIIDRHGVFQAVNPAFTTILGWEADEVIGRPLFDFVIADDLARTTRALLHASDRHLPVFENRYRHQDGGFRWLSWVATPEDDLIYASGRHITAEKEQAEALRLHQNIIQSDSSPICAFDTDYRLIAFNPAHEDKFRRVRGVPSRIGDVLPDLLGVEQQPAARAQMRRALDGESFTVIQQHDIREHGLAGGKTDWELSYSPLRDAGGTIIGAFLKASDVSARLLAAAELHDAQEALRQAQKMEAVGQLTGGLAHDFNNLLMGISGSLEMMQIRIGQGRIGEVDRYIAAAHGATTRAASLTHRLLAFSRRQTLAPKPIDVARLVAGMEELIRRTVGPAIEIETIEEPGLWQSLIDPSQLENAVLNLCLNARDAMPEGGRITITSMNRAFDVLAKDGATKDGAAKDGPAENGYPQDRRPASATGADDRGLEAGQYVAICVADTGSGMPPEVIAKAFDPFFTTKPIGMGTGLGLSMIYGFAKQSGGSVAIRSEVGVGTRVCVYLPRHDGDPAASDDQQFHDDPPRADAGETVLVIDDDATVRMLVAEVLTDLGYQTIEACDGPTGLKLVESGQRIDLLVTDVGLPGGMNGRQVADAARVLRPGLRVLFITGYAESAVLGDGHLDPGMDVLTKPFAVDTLAARLRELIIVA